MEMDEADHLVIEMWSVGKTRPPASPSLPTYQHVDPADPRGFHIIEEIEPVQVNTRIPEDEFITTRTTQMGLPFAPVQLDDDADVTSAEGGGDKPKLEFILVGVFALLVVLFLLCQIIVFVRNSKFQQETWLEQKLWMWNLFGRSMNRHSSSKSHKGSRNPWRDCPVQDGSSDEAVSCCIYGTVHSATTASLSSHTDKRRVSVSSSSQLGTSAGTEKSTSSNVFLLDPSGPITTRYPPVFHHKNRLESTRSMRSENATQCENPGYETDSIASSTSHRAHKNGEDYQRSQLGNPFRRVSDTSSAASLSPTRTRKIITVVVDIEHPPRKSNSDNKTHVSHHNKQLAIEDTEVSNPSVPHDTAEVKDLKDENDSAEEQIDSSVVSRDSTSTGGNRGLGEEIASLATGTGGSVVCTGSLTSVSSVCESRDDIQASQ